MSPLCIGCVCIAIVEVDSWSTVDEWVFLCQSLTLLYPGGRTIVILLLL